MRPTRTTLFCLLIFLGGRECDSQLTPSTPDQGAFAFPDPSGTRLLVTADISQPERFKTALCGDAGRVTIQFEQRQQSSEGGTGRDTPENFDLLAGSIFRLVGGKLDSAETCFLPSDSLMAAATVVPVQPRTASDQCGPDMRRQVASARGREVANCWPIVRLPADKHLVLVEFVRQGNDALAAVTLVDGARVIFADYAGTYRGDRQDVWRVDDGGVLSPDSFRIVFLLQRGDLFALGIDWSAGEGASLAVFISSSGNRFTQVAKDYWYRAPV